VERARQRNITAAAAVVTAEAAAVEAAAVGAAAVEAAAVEAAAAEAAAAADAATDVLIDRGRGHLKKRASRKSPLANTAARAPERQVRPLAPHLLFSTSPAPLPPTHTFAQLEAADGLGLGPLQSTHSASTCAPDSVSTSRGGGADDQVYGMSEKLEVGMQVVVVQCSLQSDILFTLGSVNQVTDNGAEVSKLSWNSHVPSHLQLTQPCRHNRYISSGPGRAAKRRTCCGSSFLQHRIELRATAPG
jgi:hypothetical protein